MRLEFNKLVASDISRIMDYYKEAAGRQLADDFYQELRAFFQKAAESPESYAIRERDLRRVNLERFPYHFLFRIVRDTVSHPRGSPSQPTTNFSNFSTIMNSERVREGDG